MFYKLSFVTLFLIHSLTWSGSLARNMRGGITEHEPARARALGSGVKKQKACKNEQVGYFEQEIVIKNLLSSDQCLTKLTTGDIGQLVEGVTQKIMSQMPDVLAPVSSVTSQMCSDFRPLESGFTWRGKGEVAYCDQSLGFMGDTSANENFGPNNEEYATYLMAIWKYHKLVEKKLTIVLARFKGTCFDGEPEIESVVTPVLMNQGNGKPNGGSSECWGDE